MISLYEALNLTQAYNFNVVWIREKENRMPYSMEELKMKFDLKNTMVCRIQPCFICGDYEGFEFTINEVDEK